MWIFRNAHFLYAARTAPELAMETAVARLGEPYRAQMLFPRLKHIADIALPGRKLIIEIDGRSHEDFVQQVKDALHTLELKRMGWDVVRCSNEVAVSQPEETLKRLLAATHRPTLAELLASFQDRGLLDALGKPMLPTQKPKPRRRVGKKRISRKAVG